jgi:hypothetical protein
MDNCDICGGQTFTQDLRPQYQTAGIRRACHRCESQIEGFERQWNDDHKGLRHKYVRRELRAMRRDRAEVEGDGREEV